MNSTRVARPAAAPPGTAPAAAWRGFYVALVLVLIGMVGLGFRPYYAAVARGAAEAHWLIHLHALVFSGWLLLLLAQVVLAFRRRVALHRRLGRFGIAYGGVLAAFGLVVAFLAPALSVSSGRDTLDEAAAFLLLPLGDMLLFIAFFVAAVAWRHRPELHKRLMVLAAVVLVYPAVARFAHAAGPLVVLLAWLLPLVAAMAHDYATRRRVAPVYLFGLAVLVAGFGRLWLMDSEAWLAVGRPMLRWALPLVAGTQAG